MDVKKVAPNCKDKMASNHPMKMTKSWRSVYIIVAITLLVGHFK
jgi:hypothetical protein